MSEDDAEWIDVDKEFGGRLTPIPGPNNPRPRPTTVRPRRTTLGNPSEDAPERVAPRSESSSSNATVISVSVISCFAIVALVLVLLYLLVLKKKLRKVEKSKLDSQFCLRVEDVAHLDIDENASLYVNTTDLQKLVSTVRIKNKSQPPPIPEEKYNNVVKVNQPVNNYGLNYQDEVVPYNTQAAEFTLPKTNVASVPRPRLPPPSTPVERTKHQESSSLKVARAAPPPPVQGVVYANHNFEDEENSQNANLINDPNFNLSKPIGISTEFQSKPVPPDSNSKPSKVALLPSKPSKIALVPSKPEGPPVASKPNIQNEHKKKSPPPVSLKPKPPPNNKALPLLRVNLLPSMSRQDSGVSTPGTASSFLSDSSNERPLENELDGGNDPAAMSVTAKRAFLEQAMAAESLKRS